MRLVLLILFLTFCYLASAQVPDSIQKAKSKRLSLSKFPKAEAPPKKNAFVVVTSDKKAPSGTWEDTWINYIEYQSRVIAGKLLMKDSSRRIYEVMLDFWVNEDGTLKDLKVTCNPTNAFVIQECTKMAINSPRLMRTTDPKKFVRMHVEQPVDIKVAGDQ